MKKFPRRKELFVSVISALVYGYKHSTGGFRLKNGCQQCEKMVLEEIESLNRIDIK